MSDLVGLEGWHAITGLCDLCGKAIDPTAQELNVLGCTFSDCQGLAYHQDCLEKYLKSIRLERNRKTGFKCPRGCGKGTSYTEPCPGRIDKSHPIHPRNEESKKRRKAKLPEPPVPKAAPQPKKEKAKQVEPPADAAKKPVVEKAKEKEKPRPAPPTPVVFKAVPVAKQLEVPPTKEKLAELRDQARREIGIMGNKDGGKDRGGEAAAASRPVAAPKQPALSAWCRTGSGPLLSTSNGSPASFPLETSASLPVAPPARRPAPHQVPMPIPMPTPSSNQQATRPEQPASQTSSRLAQQLSEPTLQQGQAAWPQQAAPAASHAAATQQPPAASAQQQHQPLPVGMDYVASDADEPKLTKAQKKNLKRAERKKKQVVSETASVQSSSEQEFLGQAEQDSLGQAEQDSLAQAEQDTLLFDMFVQALVSHKVLHSLQQLQQLGFPKWACVAAVKRFGCQLEAAVSWLLEEEAGDAESMLQAVADTCPAIDIEDELQELTALQWQSGLSATCIQEAILDNHGDVQKTRASLADNMDGTSVNGSHPSLSHAASCLSVQNGVFAYSISNDSGDEGSELHGHFTQESNSILDGLLEPSEPSLTPTAGSLPDLLAAAAAHQHAAQQLPQQQQQHYRGNGTRMAMFHDEQLTSWAAAPGGAAGVDGRDAAAVAAAAAAAGFMSSQQLGGLQGDSCWHPLTGPSLLGLGARPMQNGGHTPPLQDAGGAGLAPAAGDYGAVPDSLLPDVLISPRNPGDNVPHVSLFQHASEYKAMGGAGGGELYDVYSPAGQAQVLSLGGMQQLPAAGNGGLGYDLKASLGAHAGMMAGVAGDRNAGGWMGGYRGAGTPTSMPSMPALVAAVNVAGDEHTDCSDELELNALLASLRCVT